MNIDKKKALKKWDSVLEKLNVNDPVRRDWMSEYAEYHQIRENVGYATLGNFSGMGGVVSAQPGAIPGTTGTTGSGDYGQQLLPVAMKVAAQTIGLDLVSVKPSPGPVIDLMYVDYRYDDREASDSYNPIVFKIQGVAPADTAALNSKIEAALVTERVKMMKGGLNKRVFFNLPSKGTRAKGNITDGSLEPTGENSLATRAGVIEFLGFSRVDGFPMFKAFRTTNVANAGSWRFDSLKNTFGELERVMDAFVANTGTIGSSEALDTLMLSTAGAVQVSLISALEDHIPGFVANGGRNAMTRGVEEETYPGIIAPNVTTKRVQIGTISVSSALKLTEIEDIKAQTGIDIVQKLEGVLVNELSQTISKQIVERLFQMGDLNRLSAPKHGVDANGDPVTMFDFNVDTYLGNVYTPGGETSMSVQRKLITKLQNASFYISTEGRVGPATFAVTNGTLAAVLAAGATYAMQPATSTLSTNADGQLYPAGKVGNITVYVDPNMRYDDMRILLGRKNNPDQPGVIFVPYLMAQSIQLVSEATFAPRLLLRSRYAITEVGFFPQKQYMTVYVTDTNGILA